LADDSYTEVLSHDKDGNIISGSPQALEEASMNGFEIKVGISGICEGLFGAKNTIKHEVFIHTGPHYYYTETGFMVVGTRPFARVVPEIPMKYKDNNRDLGWAILRSDGHVAGLFYDPYTLKYRKTYTRHAMRWFVKYKKLNYQSLFYAKKQKRLFYFLNILKKENVYVIIIMYNYIPVFS